MDNEHLLRELGCCAELQTALSSGITDSGYREIILSLTSKIKHYAKLEETVQSKDDLMCFAMEISSFLTEMCCTYSVLLEGPMSSRYRTPSDARLLVDYLSGECALLFIVKKEPLFIMQREPSSPSEVLAEICNAVDVSIQDEQCITIFEKIVERIDSSKLNPVKLILSANERLTTEQWSNLEKFYESLTEEYNLRLRMMLVRIDTTIDSFRWKRDTAALARDEYKVKRSMLCKLAETLAMKDMSLLLSTDESVYNCEKVSSTRLKRSGKNTFKGYLELMDRGGRVKIDETPPMPHFSSREEGQESENLRKRYGKPKTKKDGAEM